MTVLRLVPRPARGTSRTLPAAQRVRRVLVVLLRRSLAASLVVVAAGSVAVSVVARQDALRISRVLTGSMAPALRPGALVVARPVTAADLRPGQTVLFVPPPPFAAPGDTPVAHRVVAVERVHGEVSIRTKGDANAAEDPWSLNASRSTVFRVCWASTLAGRLADLASRGARSLLVASAIAAVTARALRGLWRPRGGRARHRRDQLWLPRLSRPRGCVQ